jgi:hypothetical protein
VGDFKQQFEDLVYHIRLFDKSISDTFLVTQFMLGLKNGLCYKCGDKYTPGHSVRLQQLLSLISLPQRKLRMGVLFCLMRS